MKELVTLSSVIEGLKEVRDVMVVMEDVMVTFMVTFMILTQGLPRSPPHEDPRVQLRLPDGGRLWHPRPGDDNGDGNGGDVVGGDDACDDDGDGY